MSKLSLIFLLVIITTCCGCGWNTVLVFRVDKEWAIDDWAVNSIQPDLKISAEIRLEKPKPQRQYQVENHSQGVQSILKKYPWTNDVKEEREKAALDKLLNWKFEKRLLGRASQTEFRKKSNRNVKQNWGPMWSWCHVIQIEADWATCYWRLVIQVWWVAALTLHVFGDLEYL